MSTLERAVAIATEAHSGRQDHAGAPYVAQSLRLSRGLTGDARIVAVLHDVVERSPWTLDRLRAQGFNDVVLSGVDALTRRPGEDYLDGVKRAAAHPVGRVVMRADLADKMDVSRLGDLTATDESLLREYRSALAILDDTEA